MLSKADDFFLWRHPIEVREVRNGETGGWDIVLVVDGGYRWREDAQRIGLLFRDRVNEVYAELRTRYPEAS